MTEFAPDSPAQKAGLKAGDVILKADGRTMDTVARLSDLIRDKKAGDKVKLEILRDRKPMTIEIPVAEEDKRPEGAASVFRGAVRDLRDLFGDRPLGTLSREQMRRLAEEFEKEGTRPPRLRGSYRI